MKKPFLFLLIILSLNFFSCAAYSEDKKPTEADNNNTSIIRELSDKDILKSLEDIKKEIRQIHVTLKASIDTFSEPPSESQEMEELSKRLNWLTWALVGLTVVLCVLTTYLAYVARLDRKQTENENMKKFKKNFDRGLKD
jgi:hypothetical protein